MNSTVQDFRIQGVTEEADINMHVDGGSSGAFHTRPQDIKMRRNFRLKYIITMHKTSLQSEVLPLNPH